MKQEIEKVAEEVDQVVDDIQQYAKNPWAVPVAAGVSLVVGLGIGFLLGRRTIQEVTETVVLDGEDFEDDSLERIAAEYAEFKAQRKSDEESSESFARVREERAIQEVVRQENRPDPADIQVDWEAMDYRPPIEHAEKIVIAGGALVLDTTNVFAQDSVDPWDYEEELKHRSKDVPYVIHKDEFWNEEEGYDQTSLDYYAGDDILVDQKNEPIYNYQTIIGRELKFGHGSSDPSVFYVRNDQRMCEYEIILNEGKFSVEVLGIHADEDSEDEGLKHSVRKFRQE